MKLHNENFSILSWLCQPTLQRYGLKYLNHQVQHLKRPVLWLCGVHSILIVIFRFVSLHCGQNMIRSKIASIQVVHQLQSCELKRQVFLLNNVKQNVQKMKISWKTSGYLMKLTFTSVFMWINRTFNTELQRILTFYKRVHFPMNKWECDVLWSKFFTVLSVLIMIGFHSLCCLM